MAKLSTSCKALAGALAEACPTQQLKSLTADGEGQICLQLADADEKRVVIHFVFFDPDEYPRSGVLVQVDEDKSKCSSAVVEKLGALSERFQDGAQLWAAIAKVLFSPLDLLQLYRGAPARSVSCLTTMHEAPSATFCKLVQAGARPCTLHAAAADMHGVAHVESPA